MHHLPVIALSSLIPQCSTTLSAETSSIYVLCTIVTHYGKVQPILKRVEKFVDRAGKYGRKKVREKLAWVMPRVLCYVEVELRLVRNRETSVRSYPKKS